MALPLLRRAGALAAAEGARRAGGLPAVAGVGRGECCVFVVLHGGGGGEETHCVDVAAAATAADIVAALPVAGALKRVLRLSFAGAELPLSTMLSDAGVGQQATIAAIAVEELRDWEYDPQLLCVDGDVVTNSSQEYDASIRSHLPPAVGYGIRVATVAECGASEFGVCSAACPLKENLWDAQWEGLAYKYDPGSNGMLSNGKAPLAGPFPSTWEDPSVRVELRFAAAPPRLILRFFAGDAAAASDAGCAPAEHQEELVGLRCDVGELRWYVCMQARMRHAGDGAPSASRVELV